jgi:hypothetical protein
MKQSGFATIRFAACLWVLFALVSMGSAESEKETMTNDTVTQMHELGFDQDVIIEKIRSSYTEFDVRLEKLMALKDAGIPQDVIEEMMRSARALKPADPNDPNAKHEPGIYLFRENHDPKLTKMDPSVSMQSKTGGIWKNAYSFGAAKVKYRAVFPELRAELQLNDRRPVFYFYFGDEAESFGGISASEFALVQMKVRDKKGWREVVVGTYNITGGESGALDKFAVPFDAEEITPAIFKVVPKADMADGEYCFYYGGAATSVGIFSGAGGAVKIFDFSLRGG